jgi:hypothetical protein
MTSKSNSLPSLWKRLIIVAVLAILSLGLSKQFFPVHARSQPVDSLHILDTTPLCGNGSAPDYGFSYNLQQPHWTVNWQRYVSEQSVIEVDEILDELDKDAIAQTMILFQSSSQVGNRVNCAVHFLRYMKLGLPSGERKDNGFVFLIVVEPNAIDVHYGVGLGLPALTAHELTSLNRLAEEVYQSTGSMDEALLALVSGFNETARSKYSPFVYPTSTPISVELPAGPLGVLSICGLICIGTLIVLFLIFFIIQMARFGIHFSPSPGSRSSRSYRTSFPSRSSAPRMRGGSGSGRSGRGN